MASFEVAHVRDHDTNMILVIVGKAFAAKPNEEQERIVDALQICAGRSGWLGTVVPVWDGQDGQLGYRAPADWSRYFSRLTMGDIKRNVNRKLECG